MRSKGPLVGHRTPLGSPGVEGLSRNKKITGDGHHGLCSSGVATTNSEAKVDDELTSLTWLHNSNILSGTVLSPPKSGKSDPKATLESSSGKEALGEVCSSSDRERKASKPGARTPTDASESNSLPMSLSKDASNLHGLTKGENDGRSPVIEPSSLVQTDPTGDHIQGDSSFSRSHSTPKAKSESKPPFSFSCLIFMAIEESTTKALPVKDIYSWIIDHYPYYKTAPNGWKNSVRHNLSLNKCFSKVEKSPNLGKGALWMVDPNFRPNLLHSMKKTSFAHQFSFEQSQKHAVRSTPPYEAGYLLGVSYGDREAKEKATISPNGHNNLSFSQRNDTSFISKLNGHCFQNAKEITIERATSDRPSPFDFSEQEPKPEILVYPIHNNSDANSLTHLSAYAKSNGNSNDFDKGFDLRKSHSIPRKDWSLGLEHRDTSPVNDSSSLTSLTNHRVLDTSLRNVGIEDVDAATAMLVLKNGPSALNGLKRELDLTDNSVTSKLQKVEYVKNILPETSFRVFSPSVSGQFEKMSDNEPCTLSQEDHPTDQKLTNFSILNKILCSKNRQEANQRSVTTENGYPCEAEALLNLASVATSIASGKDPRKLENEPTRTTLTSLSNAANNTKFSFNCIKYKIPTLSMLKANNVDYQEGKTDVKSLEIINRSEDTSSSNKFSLCFSSTTCSSPDSSTNPPAFSLVKKHITPSSFPLNKAPGTDGCISVNNGRLKDEHLFPHNANDQLFNISTTNVNASVNYIENFPTSLKTDKSVQKDKISSTLINVPVYCRRKHKKKDQVPLRSPKRKARSINGQNDVKDEITPTRGNPQNLYSYSKSATKNINNNIEKDSKEIKNESNINNNNNCYRVMHRNTKSKYKRRIVI